MTMLPWDPTAWCSAMESETQSETPLLLYAYRHCCPLANTQDKDIIRLVIGYHQLEGKRISLKKPFAILEKARMLRWPLPAGGF